MFARKVAARLKPDSLAMFTKLMECEIVPWLRKQEGFLDLITLATPDGREVATVSFWGHEGNAQVFDSIGYPKALKMLGEILEGAPYVKTFQVVGSTFQGSLAQPSEAEDLIQQAGSGEPGYSSYETSV